MSDIERIDEFNEITKNLLFGNPFVTSSIQSKVRKFLKGNVIGLFKEFDDKKIYLVSDGIGYFVTVRKINGVDVYSCEKGKEAECQGYGTSRYCSHTLAVLIYRYFNNEISFDDVEDYYVKVMAVRERYKQFLKEADEIMIGE